ncbi:DUF1559 family PulG-like putative transporter [Lignipirellula cremea]|uniref:DUF1559 domain-containing protein n=1 Tax=Lignipirellula cremea TaxID=2528010 RepID=A0A518DNC4_9BACT|nr:DUF1559 domain-containing protein [Lignipirellula cremea]QDU93337.1 hypothetical protein Pla8534_11170 [Lignipirellula cremea]
MSIPFECPHCHSWTLVEEEFIGQSGDCFTCRKPITIPVPQLHQPLTNPSARPGLRRQGLLLLGGVVLAVLLLTAGGIAYLLVSAQAASAPGVLAAQHAQTRANFERIAAALEAYRLEHGAYPPAYSVDATGQPLLSWRVLILPYLGYDNIYRQFALDQPFDGDQNQWLSSNPPAEFSDPDDLAGVGETACMAVIGPRTLFNGNRPVKREEITDRLDQTLALIEVHGHGVLWSQPIDLSVDMLGQGLTGLNLGEETRPVRGVYIATADGKAHYLSSSIPADYLQALTTINGGEDAPLADYTEAE